MVDKPNLSRGLRRTFPLVVHSVWRHPYVCFVARQRNASSETRSGGPDSCDQLRYLVVDLAFRRQQAVDLLHGVHDSGVISATEDACDGGVAQVGQLTHYIHADLARLH